MNLTNWADGAWADGSWVPSSWGASTPAPLPWPYDILPSTASPQFGGGNAPDRRTRYLKKTQSPLAIPENMLPQEAVLADPVTKRAHLIQQQNEDIIRFVRQFMSEIDDG